MGDSNIDPDAIYNNFQLYSRQQRISWSIPGPLSGDFVAGLALAIYILHKDHIVNYVYIDPEFKIITLSEEGYQNEEITFDNIDNILSNYYSILRSAERIAEDLVLVSKTGYSNWPTKIGYFTWWILNPEIGCYFLVSFRTPEFIQGLLTIFNAYGKNFQDYVFVLPFQTIDTPNGIRYQTYNIEGYAINIYELNNLIDRARLKYD